mmetsp:Transcript_13896/g.29659  ORF Transcript_13896/g.29659 Transcript_13896/m.29659 type:complete len:237 (-) Transcript_13896:1238-1948(-)
MGQFSSMRPRSFARGLSFLASPGSSFMALLVSFGNLSSAHSATGLSSAASRASAKLSTPAWRSSSSVSPAARLNVSQTFFPSSSNVSSKLKPGGSPAPDSISRISRALMTPLPLRSQPLTVLSPSHPGWPAYRLFRRAKMSTATSTNSWLRLEGMIDRCACIPVPGSVTNMLRACSHTSSAKAPAEPVSITMSISSRESKLPSPSVSKPLPPSLKRSLSLAMRRSSFSSVARMLSS